MQIHTRIDGLRAALAEQKAIAFVPTMGNLHAGHIALMKAARHQGQTVVASIFVNRLQFGPNEDFNRYPRTFDDDCAHLRAAGVDHLFAPDETTLYPETQQYFVDTPAGLEILEGAARPGHFRGVATVVLKLFNIVGPHAALFGKKDYQQLMLIRNMVSQLELPVRIIGEETVRAGDGLALSSRNGYLTPDERAEAPRLYRALNGIRTQIEAGRHSLAALEQKTAAELATHGWKVDYIAIRRQSDLSTPEVDNPTEPLVVLAAARLGSTRLIDNLEITR